MQNVGAFEESLVFDSRELEQSNQHKDGRENGNQEGLISESGMNPDKKGINPQCETKPEGLLCEESLKGLRKLRHGCLRVDVC